MASGDAPDETMEEFRNAMLADRREWERKQARGRRVAFAFLPVYFGGAGLMTWGISRVDDPRTMGILLAGLAILLVAQWGQPFWLEYLNRKRSADDR